MSSVEESEFSARRRRRASMACLSCRKSRIRCKTDAGQDTCSQCRQMGTDCRFDERDGRKNRANSKAVANELSKRIQHLEALLRENGQGSAIPEQARRGPEQEQQELGNAMETDSNSESQCTPSFYDEEPPYLEAPQMIQAGAKATDEIVPGESRAIIGKLIPRPVKFDMASGRVRFFGPTTNMHILSRSTSNSFKLKESFWPISTLVRDLSPETHDYIIDLFFDCHNSALHIVHKWAFFDDLRTGGTQWYSTFLHMCMLAEGYRYADKSRPDIRRLSSPAPSSPSSSSIFHTHAKKMAELELVKPGGVPSIQAFFLLGDLEVGIGRDDVGWMFAGMSFRLLFDVGLHVDPKELGLTERETQIRHMVLWACIMNDVYWALYLGRPTMLKSSDMAPACLTKDFDRLIQSQTRTYAYEKTIETRVYEAVLQLMDLLEPLCETRDLAKNLKPSDAYLKIATMDRRLNNWYNELPERLRWTDDNIRSAPASFYLLHTQYHTALILLHRTFPISSPQSSSARHSGSTHFSTLSRNVCVSNAVRVAEIIAHYHTRFAITRVFVTGLQHVGTAATALMAEVSMLQAEDGIEAERERKRLLEYLIQLREAMKSMSDMYQPAVLMATVVGHFVRSEGVVEELPIERTGEKNEVRFIIADRDKDRGKQKQPITVPSTTRTTRANTVAPELPSISSFLFTQAPSQSNTNTDPLSSSAYLNTHGTASSNHRPFTRNPTPFESTGGLPYLPSSWLEEMNWEEDTEFLNLMGLKDLQAVQGGPGGGLMHTRIGEGPGPFAELNEGAGGLYD